MLAFLVQCIGSSTAGEPELRTKAGDRCPAPSEVAGTLAWRKHDWPDRRIRQAEPLGHQASDSVLDRRANLPIVIQTFDFGDDGRVFGRLDRGNGDGGDAIVLVDGAAWIFFTEDGGAGQQWFVAEACRTDPRPAAAQASWLVFSDDVTGEGWRERVARLVQAKRLDECPGKFNSAYTRYKRETLPVPFRFVKPGSPVAHSMIPVDTIVSEHFGGQSVPQSDHLERFFFGRGLGKYRWERWESLDRNRRKDAETVARDFGDSGRCPSLPYSEPPSHNWVLVDCRTWTNLVRLTEPWSAEAFDWPGAAFAPLQSRVRAN